MFFVLSKVLLIFIFPFTWILLLLIAAVFVRRPQFKRRFLLWSVIVLLVFSNPFLMNRFARLWDYKPTTLKPGTTYSCAIILGGFSSDDANGNGFFTAASDRFIEGLKLFTTHKVTYLLISGGSGNLVDNKFRESTWVKAQLKLLNVPDSCIIVENQSRNTIENAAFSKILLQKKHLASPYILVTSAFHMRRSLRIFKKTEMDVIPYPCNYMAGNSKNSVAEMIPDAQMFSYWNLYIKEVIGHLVNYIKLG